MNLLSIVIILAIMAECIGSLTPCCAKGYNFLTKKSICRNPKTNQVSQPLLYCKVYAHIREELITREFGELRFDMKTTNKTITIPSFGDLEGKIYINFCVSLAASLAIKSYMDIISNSYTDMFLCAVRGFLCYFFFMVSFFWTNAIAIQVFRSVRNPTIVTAGWKEFGWYALYAWGSGALLTICMAIVNFHPGDHEKPGIGLNHCWFYEGQQWYYMYSVIAILFIVNVCILAYTIMLVRFPRYYVNKQKAMLIRSIVLLLLVGLPWVFEMASVSAEAHIVWALVDNMAAIQGLLIFLVLVVFRKGAVRAMHAQGWLSCAAPLVERYLARPDDEEIAAHHTEVPTDDII